MRCFVLCFAAASRLMWACLAASAREVVGGVCDVALAFAALVLWAGGAAAFAAALVCERVLRAGAVGGTAAGRWTRRLRLGLPLVVTGLVAVVGATLGIGWFVLCSFAVIDRV